MKTKYFGIVFMLAVTILAGCTIEVPDAPPPAPSVGFTETVSDCMTVTFTNLTTDATSYLWDFGDGTTSTDFEPYHTYATGGAYNVSLTAFGNGAESQVTNSFTITLSDISITNQNLAYDFNITINGVSEGDLPAGSTLDISNLPEGSYNIATYDPNNGNTQTATIVISTCGDTYPISFNP